MITIIYSTHKDEEYNNNFKQHLIKSVGLKDVQILEYLNYNQYSLAELYNKGVSESKYDIIVCCHNDIKLESGWGKNLINDFNKNPDFGIIGKAGSCYFPESGIYWEKMHETMVGHVWHNPEKNKKWINKYSAKLPELIPVVTIDGLFISFHKNRIKHLFDEAIGKFHFYDHPFCLKNYLDGVKIGVTFSFEITHHSIGRPNKEFFESKEKFLSVFKDKLPIDLKPEAIYVPEIKEKPIPNIKKVAIIILTKGKVDMLKDCISSYFTHCNKNLFDIFITDTGSNDNEKTEINEFIKNYSNIKLIEYEYYNFAKINNDVVKNHITNDYEFLLFSNNDIKLLNNVIYGMLKIFKSNPKCGTVGCRLHFENNLIQHDGIFVKLNKSGNVGVGHLGINTYYSYTPYIKNVIGSTAALLMIKKSIFEKCGSFNESYSVCFEDVELNLKCILSGLANFYDGNLVAYHYESQTRDKDTKHEIRDYKTILIPFIEKNYNYLVKHFIYE